MQVPIAELASTPAMLVSVSEAARLLSLSERKTWTLLMSGAFRRVQVGRAVRIDVESLRAFVARGGQTDAH